MHADSIFLFAGETSADLYAGMLLDELKHTLPQTRFWGVGGPHSCKQTFECIMPMQAFQVMGFSDVIKAFPKLACGFFRLKRAILKENPKMVVFIDQPSFGMKLAKRLRKAGYKGKIAQVVAPTVWAWNASRAEKMAKDFDLLLTLFDFEPAYFAHTSLKCRFMGHPIVQLIDSDVTNSLSLDPTRPILSIFPGSRPHEVKRNLKKQLKAAELFCQNHPEMQIVVSSVTGKELPHNVISVPFERRYELMRKSRYALAKSGTVTLELALHQVPTVVTYELSWLNFLMAKHVMKLQLDHFCIANILSKKELFIERIKPPVTSEEIASCLQMWHDSPERIERTKKECALIRKCLLGKYSPIQICAKELCELL